MASTPSSSPSGADGVADGARGSFDGETARLRWFGATLAVLAGCALLFLLVGLVAPAGWNILLMAPAGAAAGLLLGFLYAATGRENDKFAPMLNALNAALAGAAVADTARDDGLLRSFVASLAESVGATGQTTLVGVILGAFGILGFLWMYTLKALSLNPAFRQAQKEEDEYERNRKAVNAGLSSTVIEPNAPAPPEAKQAAEKLIQSLGGDAATVPVARVKDLGKAQLIAGQFGAAIESFRKVLADSPGDASAMQYLAAALLNSGRERDAIPFLEQLASDPATPVSNYKLLGYAYLFLQGAPDQRQKLLKAVQWGGVYLKAHPEDAAAILNLACAYAQLANFDRTTYRQPMLDTLRLAIGKGGAPIAGRVRQLLAGDDDFAPFAADPEFQAVLQTDPAELATTTPPLVIVSPERDLSRIP